MSKPLVYLCGPITGLNYKGAKDWRDYAGTWFKEFDIDVLSPMRGKEYLAHIEKFSPDGEGQTVMSTPPAIVKRDTFDVTKRADLILANLLGAKITSIGSVFEFGLAYGNNVPIIAAMETHDDEVPENNNIHDHAFIRQTALCYGTLEEALVATRIFLMTGI